MNRKLIVLLMLVLSGCGGGSGGGDSTNETGDSREPPMNPPSDSPTTEQDMISGGPPDSPTPVSLSSPHEISNNPFYNYFRYSATKDEKLVVHASLSIPMSDTQKARCGSSPGSGEAPSSYETQVHVYDTDMNRIDGVCGQDLVFLVPADGDYILNFEFPSNGSGVFRVASVVGNSPVTSPSTQVGTPSSPSPIDEASPNPLSADVFYNYYKVTGSAGDKVIIHADLNRPLSEQQKTRCASSQGTGSNPSSYDTQIHVYDANLNRVDGICGEDITFEFPETGTYIFHFDFAEQSLGQFNASVLR